MAVVKGWFGECRVRLKWEQVRRTMMVGPQIFAPSTLSKGPVTASGLSINEFALSSSSSVLFLTTPDSRLGHDTFASHVHVNVTEDV